jgi:hypothetical protein
MYERYQAYQALGHYLFEVNKRSQYMFVADYNPYCAGVRAKKMELAGYCVYLQVHNLTV